MFVAFRLIILILAWFAFSPAVALIMGEKEASPCKLRCVWLLSFHGSVWFSLLFLHRLLFVPFSRPPSTSSSIFVSFIRPNWYCRASGCFFSTLLIFFLLSVVSLGEHGGSRFGLGCRARCSGAAGDSHSCDGWWWRGSDTSLSQQQSVSFQKETIEQVCSWYRSIYHFPSFLPLPLSSLMVHCFLFHCCFRLILHSVTWSDRSSQVWLHGRYVLAFFLLVTLSAVSFTITYEQLGRSKASCKEMYYHALRILTSRVSRLALANLVGFCFTFMSQSALFLSLFACVSCHNRDSSLSNCVFIFVQLTRSSTDYTTLISDMQDAAETMETTNDVLTYGGDGVLGQTSVFVFCLVFVFVIRFLPLIGMSTRSQKESDLIYDNMCTYVDCGDLRSAFFVVLPWFLIRALISILFAHPSFCSVLGVR